MKQIYTRFMRAGRQRGSFENETVPVVCRAARLLHVRTKLGSRTLFNELIVDKKLHFDASSVVLQIDRPARNCF